MGTRTSLDFVPGLLRAYEEDFDFQDTLPLEHETYRTLKDRLRVHPTYLYNP